MTRIDSLITVTRVIENQPISIIIGIYTGETPYVKRNAIPM